MTENSYVQYRISNFMSDFNVGSSSNELPHNIDPSLDIDTTISLDNNSPDSLQSPAPNLNLGKYSTKYRYAPEDLGKKGRSAWVWEHGFRLQAISTKSVWWLCRRCSFRSML